MCKFTKELWLLTHVRISYQLKILRQDKIMTSSRLVLLCINWRKFITELWPLNHVRAVFLLLMTRMNGWNLTNSVVNVCILTCYKTSLDFVNIICHIWEPFSLFSPGRGYLCHTDTFLVCFVLILSPLPFYGGEWFYLKENYIFQRFQGGSNLAQGGGGGGGGV